MNGRGFDCLLIPIWLFVWFMIALKYPFMKPFESYDSNGKAIVITYQESTNNEKEEAARTAQLAKEAAEIKAS